MPADIELRWQFDRLKRRVGLGIGGGGLGGNEVLTGGILVYRSIPEMISETRVDLGLALCTGSWVQDNGDFGLYINLGNLVLLTPRSPNNQTIIATVGGLWMWRLHFEEAPDEEVVVSAPVVAPHVTSYPKDFLNMDGAVGDAGGPLTTHILDFDGVGNHRWYRKVAVQPTEGVQNRDWYVNLGGFYYDVQP